MTELFAASFHGPAFEYFGVTHLAALGALVLLNLILIFLKSAGDRARTGVRPVLALVLLGNEIAWRYWDYSVGRWSIQTMLPFYLCSVPVWAGARLLVSQNYRIYEFMYSIGIGGGVQALATPGR